MAQAITPALEAILASKLQVGADKPRAEIEIDWNHLEATGGDTSAVRDDALVARYPFDDAAMSTVANETVSGLDGVLSDATLNGCSAEFDGSTDSEFESSSDPSLGPTAEGTLMAWVRLLLPYGTGVRDHSGSPAGDSGWQLIGRAASGMFESEIQYRVGGTVVRTGIALDVFDGRLRHVAMTWDVTSSALFINGSRVYSGPAPGSSPIVLPWHVGKNGELSQWFPGRIADLRIFNEALADAEIAEIAAGGSPCDDAAVVTDTIRIPVASIDLDRSRKMAAAQLDALLDNESSARGWYTGGPPIFTANNPIRAFAWYGVRDNRVRVFTGITDRLAEHRNPKTLGIKARSRMKWMIEQGFRATAPQLADEEGAVRTEDNGVYIGKTIAYIVGDILDRGGWPAADRVIDAPAITLSEYVLADGGSWADQIAGADRLTTAAGCDFLEDELGNARFEPSPLVATSEPEPVWEYAAGVNVLALDHQTDDEDRVTRVEVGGPMTSEVPMWDQTWSTSKLDHPAGVWYDDTDPDNIRVVDRVTKYIYKIRQSDRVILTKKYLGGYPLGLSGIPGDATHYYVLHAPWRNTGSTSGNSVKRYLKTDNSLVSTSTLPNGRWSDLKSDGTHLWLTNYDDGKLYKKSYNAGGAATAVDDFTIVYGGETQEQATGLWLLGTEIGVFFGPHKRFLVVDTSDPENVTGQQSTKGTRIAGGERDTDTGTDLYAVAGAGSFGLAYGMVAKFALAELVTDDVTAIAVDWDLEDALGIQSGIADRIHVDCPNDDDPHPYEARPATHSMKVVQSLEQAQDVADAQLAIRKRLRRQLDLAMTGHPGTQLNDPVRHVDAIAGMDGIWVVDTYRKRIAATYTMTASLLPWEAP